MFFRYIFLFKRIIKIFIPRAANQILPFAIGTQQEIKKKKYQTVKSEITTTLKDVW